MMAIARHSMKRLAGQMAFGALIGAGSTALLLWALDGRGLDLSSPSQMLPLLAGIIYALIGLLVGFGSMAPGAGAKLLNVEDETELREERPRLGASAISCLLVGIFLLALAVGEQNDAQSILSPQGAGLVAAACLAGILLIGRSVARRTDEFSRALSIEATAAAMYVTMFAAALWAMLSLFGIAIGIGPVGIVALLALIELVAIFAVCGKRGLLMPRG